MREVLGVILMVPQGLVPLVLLALDVDSKSWFVAMHLPTWAQLPAAIAFTVAGLVLMVSGVRAERGR